MIESSLLVAISEMRRHPVRTLLTISGVTVAIATVVGVGAMLGSVHRLIANVLDESGGLRNVTIMYSEQRRVAGRWTASRLVNPLSTDDSAAVTRLLSNEVSAATARLNIIAVISNGITAANTQAYAVEPDYFSIFGRRLLEGRLLDKEDVENASLVTVLGKNAAATFSPNGSVVGSEIRLNHVRLRVVGVVADTGLGEGRGMEALIPISTARFRLPVTHSRGPSTMIHVQVKEGVNVADFKELLVAMIASRHRGYTRSDFEVATAEENRRQAEDALLLISLLFFVISCLCLFTGGVGIMNVLLSAVAERTREIGLRRAVGARRRDIFKQFLFESLSFTLAGGGIGLFLGYGVGYALSAIVNMVMKIGGDATYRLQPSLNPAILIISIITSSSVGIAFGLYPALKASHLDPVEALRVE